MGSLLRNLGRKPMWLCPKVVGNPPFPSERWGHSSSFFHGHLYIFGGCCEGVHYNDVVVLNLESMTWSALVTLGNRPGPRDSHTATLWGNKIVVFGGTNGTEKLNDLHVLDLGTKQWFQPTYRGTLPSPREGHTATLLGDQKLVVFGGSSGEGASNYLNDLHVLDLKTMSWVSCMVNGCAPPLRDTHTSIAFGSKIFVYGGDCEDCYYGDVHVLDFVTLTWSTLEINGLSPARRAGHASVKIGTKMYIIGGIGDGEYYNDVWVLDTVSSTWSKLEIGGGHSPPGRYSHTATVTFSDIVIYGGWGEDKQPFGDILILQLGDDHPIGPYNNITMSNIFEQQCDYRQRRGLHKKVMILGSYIEPETKHCHELGYSDSKRLRRSVDANLREKEIEPGEHSLSVSQNLFPSQSDQEQTALRNSTISQCVRFPTANRLNECSRHNQSNECIPQRNLPDMYIIGEKRGNLFPSAQTFPVNHISNQNLVGADVYGKVDGPFDSGYLMTATVNGRIFRGVLFPTAPNMMCNGANQNRSTSFDQGSRGTMYSWNPTNQANVSRSQGCNVGPRVVCEKTHESAPNLRTVSSREQELRDRSDLQGVVFTQRAPAFSPKYHMFFDEKDK